MAEFDANNNSASPGKAQEKYSLRPRASLKRDEPDRQQELEDGWKPATRGRSAKRRQKPKPLSRYRRKTANARERSRMREINEAFEALRRAVPHLAVDAHNEKLTKITTLRLAMKYISALSGLLSSAAAAPPAASSPPSSSFSSSSTSSLSSTSSTSSLSSTSSSSSSSSLSPSSLSLSVPPDLAALSCCLSPSTSDDVDSLLSEYASDLLGDCSSAPVPSDRRHRAAAAFLRDLPAPQSSCSAADALAGGFPSPLHQLTAADFPVDVAAAFMPFADHPLPPIDFNGDPYSVFEDGFACAEFSS